MTWSMTFTVLVLGRRADARPDTTVDVEVEAGARVGAGDVLGAGTVREELLDEVQGASDGAGGCEGAEVSGAALVLPSPGEVDAGELLFQVYLDVGICLVVLEADVVLGFVALDEGVFEDKGLALGIGDYVFVLGDARGQVPTLEGERG